MVNQSLRLKEALEAKMPNFFFDLRVGDRFIVDDKGTECETAEKAREEALHSMV